MRRKVIYTCGTPLKSAIKYLITKFIPSLSVVTSKMNLAKTLELKLCLLVISFAAICHTSTLKFRPTLGAYKPNFVPCADNTNLNVTNITFDSTPALGYDSTLFIAGNAQSSFVSGSYTLNLTNAGELVSSNTGALGQTNYTSGSPFNFNYTVSLSKFIPSGNYQLIVQLNQPETFPNNEIMCMNVSFSAY